MSLVGHTLGHNMTSKARRNEIEKFILQNVSEHPCEITSLTAGTFSISRQAALRYVRSMVQKKVLKGEGATRNRKYSLVQTGCRFDLPVTAGLEEDVVWRERVKPFLGGIPENIAAICYYGFTEMFNNVIDHSQAKTATVSVGRTAAGISMSITDNGIGIFNKVAALLNLAHPRESILELSKGKFTTDPTKHSGQGIFFTSRSFDCFCILSGNLAFIHRTSSSDWLLEDVVEEQKGTAVIMEISLFSNRTTKEVFDQYATPDNDYGFTRTHVPVALARFGEDNLVSRSQAKRVLAGINRFEEVLLDFAKVEAIGQAFADEIFRVFAREHPGTHLTWGNANEQIEGMIRRALSETKLLPQDKNAPQGDSTRGTITLGGGSQTTSAGNISRVSEGPLSTEQSTESTH